MPVCSWSMLLRQAQPSTQKGTLQVKFFIHFNYSLHKMKVGLIRSVHKKLIRSGIFVWKIRGLSLQRDDQKTMLHAEVTSSPQLGKRRSKRDKGWRKEQGILFNKKLSENKHFSLSWSLCSRAADLKGFLPCVVPRPLNTHNTADAGSSRKPFWAAELERQTIAATSR